MTKNPNFYPTPLKLVVKMLSKINKNRDINTILEPSAGTGTLIEVYKSRYYYCNSKISAIEIDPELRATLIGKNIDVIDSDFLQYEGIDKFDLILANFPFSDGEHHLNKALDIMFNGQIICLINAETIKNPYTNTRKELVQRLNKLNASIEFHSGEFKTSETIRKTDVEVALISVEINQEMEDVFSQNLKEDNYKFEENLEGSKDLNYSDEVMAIVSRYRNDKEVLTKQIYDFYKNYHMTSKYLSLNVRGEESYSRSSDSLTMIMQNKVNDVSKSLKIEYWKESLSLKEVKARLTSKNKDLILSKIQTYSKMEFSENNIRDFILSVVKAYPKMIDDSIMELFDTMTSYALKDSRWGDEFKANIHYFNAWKSNNGFKINNKVILPFYKENSWSELKLAHKGEEFINDMEKIMSYFTGQKSELKAREIIEEAFKTGNTRNIDTEFFIFSFFKKGTVHLKFKDENLLRRFNIEACKLKKWLPMDYGAKETCDMNEDEKDMVNAFEGLKNYSKTTGLNKSICANSAIKLIA